MPAQIKFVDNTEDEPVIKGIPQVPKEYSKKLSSVNDGTVMYYIDKSWGHKNKLWPKMNFSNTHPIDTNFCEITIPIERI